MDERSQHGYPPQPQHAAPEHARAMPQHAGTTPWPSYAPPVPNAPIAGHAPYPGPAQPAHAPQHQQLPTMQQFQYAADGYVLPGAGEAHGSPLSAHGGTIGVAQPYQPAAGMPLANGAHHQQAQGFAQQYAQPQQLTPQPQQQYALQPQQPQQYAQPQGFAQPHGFGAGAAAPAMHPMLDANGQPQAWAFPTPNGLQLVQPGATTSLAPGGGMVPGAPTARRMRWETIVPALAVLCLIAAIGLFMHDFDRITGRDANDAAPSAESTRQVDATAPKAETPDVQATVDQANAMFAKGRFDEAANLLHPLLDGPNADPAAVALHDKVDSANARDAALLKRLAGERRGKKWTAVVATIGQIEQLRPLDRPLVSLRSRAKAAAQAARAAKLKAAAEARAAAKLKAAGPSNSGGASGGGGHGRHAMPPVAGGSKGASTNVRPPADVPKGSIPAVPNVPNPAGTNPGVVGGGQAAETMCAVTRTARHGGEDHSHATC